MKRVDRARKRFLPAHWPSPAQPKRVPQIEWKLYLGNLGPGCTLIGYSHSADVLFVEPQIFHAPAIEDAVDHCRPPLDVGLPAHRAAVVENDRPGAVLGQFALDLPHKLLALLGVGLDRLPIDQLVHLGTTVAVIVQLPAAPVGQVETEVGIDTAALAGEADGVVLRMTLGSQFVVSMVSSSPSI